MSARRPVCRQLLQQYIFLLLILLALILAELFPWVGSQEGPLFAHITVKYIAVAVIFFSSGLSTATSNLLASFKLLKLHAFVQVFSFIITPCVVRFAIFCIKLVYDLDNWIATGLIAVSCIPPPVSSAVILTHAAKGNEPAAVLNSALGGVLGIFLTPALLYFHVGMSCTLPLHGTLRCLLSTAACPLLAGQLARWLPQRTSLTKYARLLPNAALLLVIFTSFCEMFLQTELAVAAHEVLATLAIVITIQIFLMCLSLRSALWIDASAKSFTSEDMVAIIFCSSQKSLTLGLPLLKTLYGGYSHLSQISLPLLIYHPVQVILGALLAPYAQHWISHHSAPRPQLP